MRRIRSHLTYANVTVTILAFIVLTGGTAVALGGANTVFTDDIADDTRPASGGNPAGGLVAADLRPGSVGSSEAANNSLTGADVNEASLGQVPFALLGGFGRSRSGQSCNPQTTNYVACAVVTHNLSRPTRFLLIAQATAFPETVGGNASGQCRIGTTAGPVSGTATSVDVRGQRENLALAAVSRPFPPGQHSFGIDCGEFAAGIAFGEAGITAVAISPR